MGFIRDIYPCIRPILFGIPIGITFVNTVGYIARVEGESMHPTLNPDAEEDDWVFLSCWAIHNNNINHGDIVTFTSPKNPDKKFIKRIIALEGDEVATIGYRRPVLRIPEGYCWVEGDNTGHTVDSNSFGPLSLGLIIAKATYIIWPPSRWQQLNSCIPNHRVPLRISRRQQQTA